MAHREKTPEQKAAQEKINRIFLDTLDASGLTQEDFAAKLGIKNRSHISNVRHGRGAVSRVMAKQLLAAYPDVDARALNRLFQIAQGIPIADVEAPPDVPRPSSRPTRDRGFLPIVGASACGPWIEAIGSEDAVDPDDWMLVGPSRSKISNAFLVIARGDSMTGETPTGRVIRDGDILLVDPNREAANGRVALVMWDDKTTIKVFFRTKNRVTLQPTNPKHNTIGPLTAAEWKQRGGRAFPVQLLEFGDL